MSDVPKVLSDFAAEYWWSEVKHLAQREDKTPLPMTAIGFYTNPKGQIVANIVLLCSWKECRVCISTPDKASVTGMSAFVLVHNVATALEMLRNQNRRTVITVVVYVRDITIGGKYALFNTGHINTTKPGDV